MGAESEGEIWMQVIEPPDGPWSDQPPGALAQTVGFAEAGLISDALSYCHTKCPI